MSFKWPWQYEFPPFFTLQTTLITRERQLEAWSRLVVEYCQFHKIYTVDLADITKSELFVNNTLNRKLPLDGVRVVFDYLEHKRHIDWLDKSKNRCHIYWRRPEEWAILIYEWAVSNSLLNTPCTLYEITQGDDVKQESFYGLDKDVLLKSLAILVEQRRAQLLNSGTGTEECGQCQLDKFHCRKMVNETNCSLRLADSNPTVINSAFSGFLSNNEIIKEGDTVIVYVNYGRSYAVEVRRGHVLTMKYGALRHEYLIGRRYGSHISASAGFIYALRPNPEMWTRALLRRTQIIYTPDWALILMLLDVKPGSVVCECGTGSGSLSHALAMAIAPTGHLYTHDIDEPRVKQVQLEMVKHGLGGISTCVQRNVIKDGFSVENVCDAVFLDLPAPWVAIKHAKYALSRKDGGRVVSFSPCIEQIQRTYDALQNEDFVQITTVELVPRKLKKRHLQDNESETMTSKKPKLKGDAVTAKSEMQCATKENNLKSCTSALLPFPSTQPTHTGYIISATLLPSVSS